MGVFYEQERPTMDEAARQLTQQAKSFDLDRYMARYA
jgi:hypothetical protein